MTDLEDFMQMVKREIETHSRKLTLFELQKLAKDYGGEDQKLVIRCFHRADTYNDWWYNKKEFHRHNICFRGWNRETGKPIMSTKDGNIDCEISSINVDYLKVNDVAHIYDPILDKQEDKQTEIKFEEGNDVEAKPKGSMVQYD